jgi:hypothetical protein
MTEHDKPSPLGLLRNADAAPNSEAVEARRRSRIVGRINELRASLQTEAELHASPLSAAELPSGDANSSGETKSNVLRGRFGSWKRAAIVALPVAAALVLWLRDPTVEPAPLFVVASGEVVVESSEGTRRLTRDQQWERGDDVNLATEEAQANIVLPSRTSLILGSQTRATVNRVAPASEAGGEARSPQPSTTSGEGVRVSRGSVQVSVTEPSERSVVVVTQQARVVMRGTLFAVLVSASPADAQTRVVVHSGEASVVSGGREYRLTAGQEWASNSRDDGGSAASGGNATPQGTPPARIADAGASDDARADRAAKGSSRSNGSDLAQQNRLFESAQAARRAGQSNLALQRFAELMATFPGSEQAHNARVEHFRLLRSLGRREEARRSARAYLTKYPRGFAATEARELTR